MKFNTIILAFYFFKAITGNVPSLNDIKDLHKTFDNSPDSNNHGNLNKNANLVYYKVKSDAKNIAHHQLYQTKISSPDAPYNRDINSQEPLNSEDITYLPNSSTKTKLYPSKKLFNSQTTEDLKNLKNSSNLSKISHEPKNKSIIRKRKPNTQNDNSLSYFEYNNIMVEPQNIRKNTETNTEILHTLKSEKQKQIPYSSSVDNTKKNGESATIKGRLPPSKTEQNPQIKRRSVLDVSDEFNSSVEKNEQSSFTQPDKPQKIIDGIYTKPISKFNRLPPSHKKKENEVSDNQSNSRSTDDQSNSRSTDDQSNSRSTDDESDPKSTVKPQKIIDGIYTKPISKFNRLPPSHKKKENEVSDNQSNSRSTDDQSNSRSTDDQSNSRSTDDESDPKSTVKPQKIIDGIYTKPISKFNRLPPSHKKKENEVSDNQSNSRSTDDQSNSRSTDDQSSSRSSDDQSNSRSTDDESDPKSTVKPQKIIDGIYTKPISKFNRLPPSHKKKENEVSDNQSNSRSTDDQSNSRSTDDQSSSRSSDDQSNSRSTDDESDPKSTVKPQKIIDGIYTKPISKFNRLPPSHKKKENEVSDNQSNSRSTDNRSNSRSTDNQSNSESTDSSKSNQKEKLALNFNPSKLRTLINSNNNYNSDHHYKPNNQFYNNRYPETLDQYSLYPSTSGAPSNFDESSGISYDSLLKNSAFNTYPFTRGSNKDKGLSRKFKKYKIYKQNIPPLQVIIYGILSIEDKHSSQKPSFINYKNHHNNWPKLNNYIGKSYNLDHEKFVKYGYMLNSECSKNGKKSKNLHNKVKSKEPKLFSGSISFDIINSSNKSPVGLNIKWAGLEKFSKSQINPTSQILIKTKNHKNDLISTNNNINYVNTLIKLISQCFCRNNIQSKKKPQFPSNVHKNINFSTNKPCYATTTIKYTRNNPVRKYILTEYTESQYLNKNFETVENTKNKKPISYIENKLRTSFVYNYTSTYYNENDNIDFNIDKDNIENVKTIEYNTNQTKTTATDYNEDEDKNQNQNSNIDLNIDEDNNDKINNVNTIDYNIKQTKASSTETYSTYEVLPTDPKYKNNFVDIYYNNSVNNVKKQIQIYSTYGDLPTYLDYINDSNENTIYSTGTPTETYNEYSTLSTDLNYINENIDEDKIDNTATIDYNENNTITSSVSEYTTTSYSENTDKIDNTNTIEIMETSTETYSEYSALPTDLNYINEDSDENQIDNANTINYNKNNTVTSVSEYTTTSYNSDENQIDNANTIDYNESHTMSSSICEYTTTSYNENTDKIDNANTIEIMETSTETYSEYSALPTDLNYINEDSDENQINNANTINYNENNTLTSSVCEYTTTTYSENTDKIDYANTIDSMESPTETYSEYSDKFNMLLSMEIDMDMETSKFMDDICINHEPMPTGYGDSSESEES
ncbi:hypothetical protein BB561_002920 [Smittium simulii]|uniref:Uncharacterized protein n=1 Tax=Smittium simulii TaxID=133385 RepID=A0A2T9YNL0_9FUNG|nr:hypothetical protein BB561_002920 [Smittium simulii]